MIQRGNCRAFNINMKCALAAFAVNEQFSKVIRDLKFHKNILICQRHHWFCYVFLPSVVACNRSQVRRLICIGWFEVLHCRNVRVVNVSAINQLQKLIQILQLCVNSTNWFRFDIMCVNIGNRFRSWHVSKSSWQNRSVISMLC